MPTQPGTPSTPLDTKQAAEKFAGLITLSDEPPTTDAAAAPSEEAVAEKPAPPEAPPQTSDTAPPAPEEQIPEEDSQTVDVDGETVTLGELKKDRLRQADYTRKTQALAEKEKRLEPEIRQRVEAELAQERTQYQQGLQTLVKALEKLQGEPDWVALRKEMEPAAYLERKADWEAQRADLEQIKAHEREEAQKAEAAQAKQFAEYRRQEHDKLMQAVPEWSDGEKAKADWQKLIATAKSYGLAEEHVLNITDHRVLLVLRDAMRYRELQREPSAQVKAKTAAIKTAKPGTPARPAPNAKQQQLLERTKSGRQRDAMAAIEAMLD